MHDHQDGASMIKVIMEETKIDRLATEHDLKQVINEPTYLLKNTSSCIDLISTKFSYGCRNPSVFTRK